MLNWLKSHPFAVNAHFERSIVLTYAVSIEQLQELIPKRLEVDSFDSSYGFLAAAMVQTKNLRPKGLPKFFGNNFFLSGFRIFVRYKTIKGKNLRGLFILKSLTDKYQMKLLGNTFTHYNYSKISLDQSLNENIYSIKSSDGGFNVELDLDAENINLPSSSPFNDWKQARRFAGPLPFTFTYNKQRDEMLIIQGVRKNWNPKPVKVNQEQFSIFSELDLKKPVLASAFIVNDIPYTWKKGKKEKFNLEPEKD